MKHPTAGIPRELVDRATTGDRDSLRALAERAHPLVWRWALGRTGEEAEADDLTQDVLIQMLAKLRSYRGDARFETWLYSLTRNAAHDHSRRRRRQDRRESDRGLDELQRPAEGPGPSRLAEQADLRDLLTACLRELPERQREVLDLVDLQGFTSVEAAKVMGIEPSSVRVHLFRARRFLRVRILERDPDLAEDFA